MENKYRLGSILSKKECMKIILNHEVAKEKLGIFRTFSLYPLIIATKIMGFPPNQNRQRRKREDFVFNEFVKIKPKNYLDIGSGYGRYALELCNKTGASGLCVYADKRDINTVNQLANELNLDCIGIAEDVLLLEHTSDYFDLIYCIELMEHIKDDRKLLTLIHKWLKPSGYFIFQTPFHFEQMPEITEHEFGHVRNGYSEKEFEKINNGMFDFDYFRIGKKENCKYCKDFDGQMHPSKLIGVGKKRSQ